MPELDNCDLCGIYTIVHGNDRSGLGRRFMLCDDCCPCYNHCPKGKYYKSRMDGK